jgi:hypothetical protein
MKRLQLQGVVLKELVDEVERSDRHEPDRARKKMCCMEFRMERKRTSMWECWTVQDENEEY